MNQYNRIIIEYFEKKDTLVKEIIMNDFQNNNFSLDSHLDNVFFKCGIISANYAPLLDSETKWIPYLNFSPENIFQEKKGIRDLIRTPVNSKRAQQILADEIVKLFHFINKEKVMNALN